MDGNKYLESETYSCKAVYSQARSPAKERPRSSKRTKWATVSYLAAISRAILASPWKRLPLAEIYRFIEENYPNFKQGRPHWKNTVRHNLSLHECFVKGELTPNEKCCYWQIHPKYYARFSRGEFSKRHSEEQSYRYEQIATAFSSYRPPPSLARNLDLDLFQPTHPFARCSRFDKEWPRPLNSEFLPRPVPVSLMCSPNFGRRLQQDNMYRDGVWSNDLGTCARSVAFEGQVSVAKEQSIL